MNMLNKSTEYLNTCDIENVQLMANGNLAIKCRNGESIQGVKPRRLFPLTLKEKYINFIDEEDTEVGLISNLKKLDKKSRKNIKAALDRFYLIPKIEQVDKIEEKMGIVRWYVQTDRGEKDFEVLNSRTDIKSYGNGHYIIKDSDDNRYEIINLYELDKASIKIIEEQLQYGSRRLIKAQSVKI